tara:strand:- start:44 stop:250 length:207 start_codon:yes stop_codon:yes gene_type:complete
MLLRKLLHQKLDLLKDLDQQYSNLMLHLTRLSSHLILRLHHIFLLLMLLQQLLNNQQQMVHMVYLDLR